MGLYAHVFDTEDAAAVRAAAVKHGLTFPVVLTADQNWDKAYKVEGVSRTIYFAKRSSAITWTSVGLDDKALAALEAEIKTYVKD